MLTISSVTIERRLRDAGQSPAGPGGSLPAKSNLALLINGPQCLRATGMLKAHRAIGWKIVSGLVSRPDDQSRSCS